jgi:streptogramin lyase
MRHGFLARSGPAVRCAAVGAVLLAIAAGVATAAVPGAVTEYSAGISSNSGPLNIAAGPDGNLWFTGTSGGSSANTAFIGRITTKGVVTEFPVRLASGYFATITAGRDGNLYFSESEQIPNGNTAGAEIGRITTQGVVTEFAVPSSGGITAGPDGNIWVTEDGKIAQFVLDAKPVNSNVNQFAVSSGAETSQIATGHDGNLYFTETSANKIGRITPAGVVTEFAVPTANAQPGTITAGPDGNVYFTETGFTSSGVLQIGRITPAGKISEFGLGGTVFEVGGITAGPDGNVYFSATTTNGFEAVGRITPTGKITLFTMPVGFDAGAITTGRDGNIWVTDPDDNLIVKMTPAGVFTTFALPAGGGSLGIGSLSAGATAGPDGNVWFTGISFIGRITPTGVVTEFPLSTKDSIPTAITAGPDGNLYFGASSPGADIGRITTQGVITEVHVPSSGGVTAGPDGNIWLTEDGKIAQLVLTTPASTSASASMVGSPSATANDIAVEALFPGGDAASADPSGGAVTVAVSGSPSAKHKKS